MAILMINYARSGGTLLNQVLGSLPKTVVLSEVHPLLYEGGPQIVKENRTPLQQAQSWYDIALSTKDFVKSIIELESYCIQNNMILIIRDWSFLSFSKHIVNHYLPSYQMDTYNTLKKHIDLKPFVFTRNAIDVWLSRGKPNVNAFFSDYLKYAQAASALKAPIYKYENFCRNPIDELRNICEYLNIPFKDITKSYKNFRNVNGDIQTKSRGQKSNQIKLFPRKKINFFHKAQLNLNKKLEKGNEIFGYSKAVF